MPPHWGPCLQPRHVPGLGVELTTLWFAGLLSVHWVTPARARKNIFKQNVKYSLANHHWLTTCFKEIQVNQQLFGVVFFWGKNNQCETQKPQAFSIPVFWGPPPAIPRPTWEGVAWGWGEREKKREWEYELDKIPKEVWNYAIFGSTCAGFAYSGTIVCPSIVLWTFSWELTSTPPKK